MGDARTERPVVFINTQTGERAECVLDGEADAFVFRGHDAGERLAKLQAMGPHAHPLPPRVLVVIDGTPRRECLIESLSIYFVPERDEVRVRLRSRLVAPVPRIGPLDADPQPTAAA